MLNANESHRQTFQSAHDNYDVIYEALQNLVTEQSKLKSAEIVGIVKLVMCQILILKSPIYTKEAENYEKIHDILTP